MDRDAVEGWINAHVEPVTAIESVHERPWSTVLRVTTTDGVVWFKACGPAQAFEPRLSAELFARWPDRVPVVLAHDERRAWMLLGDAGTPVGFVGSYEALLVGLPRYAELQRAEAARAAEHLAHGVPDLRMDSLPARFDDLMLRPLPIEDDEFARLRSFAPRFAELCHQLSRCELTETLQHDDLHGANLYADREQLRVLDWGDSSVSHPFFSLVVPFRFLDEVDKLPPDDPCFTRLRDAYLEPWGDGHAEAFELAIRVGAFAHVIAWARQRDHLPEAARPVFDKWFQVVLRRAIGQIAE